MTNQEMFDIVSQHLLTQNEASIQDGRCLYHGPNGLKCAIGCLIPDRLYVQHMENIDVRMMLNRFPSLHQYVPNIDLATDLQNLHDDVDHEFWLGRLAAIAKDWELTFTYNATLAS